MEHMPRYSGPNQILARAERTIEDACEGVDVVFIMRVGDKISYRYSAPDDQPFSTALAEVHVRHVLDTIFPPPVPEEPDLP